jgi:hypothetical protein
MRQNYIFTSMMQRIIAAVLVLGAIAWAGDFKPAKLVEVRDATQLGASVETNVRPGGQPSDATPAIAYRCEITVLLDGVSYTAVYPESKHLNPSELIAGDTIPARIEGNKLVLQTADGKQIKSKIIARAPAK